MNGIHDLGGMDGLGPVDADADGLFHADWERLVFGLHTVVMIEHGLYNLDEFRHARERIPPATYLDSAYYENVLTSIEILLFEAGTADPDQYGTLIEGILSGTEPSSRTDPELTRRVLSAVDDWSSDWSPEREPREPEFPLGTEVTVRNVHPEGHTRCPRYVRRATGVVEEVHGTYVVPDDNAHGTETAEPLYAVRFDFDELWGADSDSDSGRASGDTLSIDLWERYLEESDGEDAAATNV